MLKVPNSALTKPNDALFLCRFQTLAGEPIGLNMG